MFGTCYAHIEVSVHSPNTLYFTRLCIRVWDSEEFDEWTIYIHRQVSAHNLSNGLTLTLTHSRVRSLTIRLWAILLSCHYTLCTKVIARTLSLMVDGDAIAVEELLAFPASWSFAVGSISSSLYVVSVSWVVRLVALSDIFGSHKKHTQYIQTTIGKAITREIAVVISSSVRSWCEWENVRIREVL